MNLYLWAAERVLNKYRRPMRVKEILVHAYEDGYFGDNIQGATPHRTMQARLSTEILDNAEQSVFVRTAPGVFFLRSLLGGDHTSLPAPRQVANLGLSVSLSPYHARRRAPPPPRESVLTVPRRIFARYCRFQGIRRDDGLLLSKILRADECEYLPRLAAEETHDYKQVVTYVLVRDGDALLTFRRGIYNRVASFLRGSRCVGFGGHVSENDFSMFSVTDLGVSANALRELHEEVLVSERDRSRDSGRLKLLGLISDDSSAIGQRHIAVVYEYDVTGAAEWQTVRRGEASINQLGWMPLRSGHVDLNEFEYWSQLCLREFYPDLVSAQPAYRIVRRAPFRAPHMLAVLGTIGSGKSVATRCLTEDYGYVEVNSGRVLADLLGIPPVPETPRQQFQELAWEFIRQPKGPRRLASAIVDAARTVRHDRIVIDGIRQKQTLSELRLLANGGLAVLYVHAAPDVAFRFYRR